MGRAIVRARPAGPTDSATRGVPDGDEAAISAAPDPYADRLLKIIPGEVISLYLSMVAILASSNDADPVFAPWIVLFACAAATWLYLRIAQKVKDRLQLGVSVAAFCVWAFAIGGPFKDLEWYSGTYAGLALALFTFLVPMIPMGQQNE